MCFNGILLSYPSSFYLLLHIPCRSLLYWPLHLLCPGYLPGSSFLAVVSDDGIRDWITFHLCCPTHQVILSHLVLVMEQGQTEDEVQGHLVLGLVGRVFGAAAPNTRVIRPRRWQGGHHRTSSNRPFISSVVSSISSSWSLQSIPGILI